MDCWPRRRARGRGSEPRSFRTGELGVALALLAFACGVRAESETPPTTTSASEAAQPAADAAPADGVTVETVLRRMAESRGMTARFVERQEYALLDEPIETRGRIAFVPPDRFARTTDAPGKTSLILDGDRFFFQDDAGADDLPQLDARARRFIDSLVVIFKGDLDELRRRYEVRWTTEAPSWRLQLLPRDRLVAQLIRSITLEGVLQKDAARLDRMVLEETGGDRSVTVFEDSELDRAFTEQEQDRLFGVASRE